MAGIPCEFELTSSAWASPSSTVRSKSSGESAGRWIPQIGIEMATLKYQIHRFSGAILHSFCIFNRQIRGKLAYRLQLAVHFVAGELQPDTPPGRVSLLRPALLFGNLKRVPAQRPEIGLPDGFVLVDPSLNQHIAFRSPAPQPHDGWKRLVCATECPCRHTPLRSTPSKRNGSPMKPVSLSMRSTRFSLRSIAFSIDTGAAVCW